jgi:long-chain acyl-CoA synthetase
VLEHADVTFAVVQDQEQVDKLLSIADKLPKLKLIIYDEPRGLRDYDHTTLKSFAEVQQMGRARGEAGQKELDASIAAGKADDIGIMLYTSGTTGRPKGVMHTNDNIIISARNGAIFDNLTENEETIAYLPIAWVGDHVFSYGQSYVCGFSVSCPEGAETVAPDRRELGTTYAFAPPRIYENLLTATMVQMEDASPFKRKMFHYFIAQAKLWGEKIMNKESVPITARLIYALGDFFVYAPLKNRFGISKVRVAYTAGEAIGPEIFSFFRSLGINLKQLYGQTEAAVYITAQKDGEIFADTVGTPNLEVDVKIDDSGEVLFKSPGVFVGYYKDDEKTNESLINGYFHTGDIGNVDAEGFLKITDRKKEMFKTSGGKYIAPQLIENTMKQSRFIEQIMVIGDGEKMPAAFIQPSFEFIKEWEKLHGIEVGKTNQEIISNPKVIARIQEEVDHLNAKFGNWEKIKRFELTPDVWSIDGGQLTPTLKLKRKIVLEMYKPLYEKIYGQS